jgi:hypothetical protein
MLFIWILGAAVSYFGLCLFAMTKQEDDLDRAMALIFGAAGCVFAWPFFFIAGLAYFTKNKFFSGVKS